MDIRAKNCKDNEYANFLVHISDPYNFDNISFPTKKKNRAGKVKKLVDHLIRLLFLTKGISSR